MSKNVHKYVTDRMIQKIMEAIKDGSAAPWQKPWSVNKVNYVTGIPYTGLNTWLLPDDSCEFITYKQLVKYLKGDKEQANRLTKGKRTFPVIFWKVIDIDEDNETNDEDEKQRFICRYYSVFKVSDIDVLETKICKTPIDSNKECDNFINALSTQAGLVFRTSGYKAFYTPSLDVVTVPPKDSFIASSEYYSTSFHEIIHWTGHKSRLDRLDTVISFGSSNYSKEELVAEMGSSILLGHFGINTERTEQNQVSYLRGWLKKLKDDEFYIISAAQKAQKAVNYLLEFEKDTQQLAV